MATELVLHHDPQALERVSDFMPVFNIEMAVERQRAMSAFISRILRESTPDEPGDYGVIPGTRIQKVLLKPGAEKLCTFFGMAPRYIAEHLIEDWQGLPEHGDAPLFYYRYKCQLYRGERFMGEAIGSCNSREKKYRWRTAERLCPHCAKSAIIKGKEEYGGGWVCFVRKGGCGAKFLDNDASILDQALGQVENPDIADAINTILKISQKRALVAAVLVATNASDSFTQDLEDDEGEPSPPPTRKSSSATAAPEPKASDSARVSNAAASKEAPAQMSSFDDSKVPAELAEMFAGLARKNATTNAYEQMKGEICKTLPDIGGNEYCRILQKHGIKRGGGNNMGSTKAALLEMWELICWAREAAAHHQGAAHETEAA